MAYTEHYFTKFEPGCFYHIYNRSVDKKPMFKNDGNYEYFLRRYDQYLSPVIDTYAYCLLGNHFHLLVRIHSSEQLAIEKDIASSTTLPKQKTAHEIVSHQFQKFFQSYAMAFNKQHERIGTLFQTPFKRALVDNYSYFTQLVYYIHANPQLHGIINDFRDWKWSSYNRFLIDSATKLQKQAVLAWFGSKAGYLTFHSVKPDANFNSPYNIDDD